MASEKTLTGPTFHTSIDLKAQSRESMIGLLNQQLADTFDLFSQTKQAHWNVKGMQFQQLHELFDQLAAQLLPHVDALAERATALGGSALGTSRMAAEASRLPELPIDLGDGVTCVKLLVERWAALAASTRTAIEVADSAGDQSTADLFTEVSRDLDKALWFLEAHVQV